MRFAQRKQHSRFGKVLKIYNLKEQFFKIHLHHFILQDSTMNLDQAGITQSRETHTPWGSPQFNDAESNNAIKLLISKDYVAGNSTFFS